MVVLRRGFRFGVRRSQVNEQQLAVCVLKPADVLSLILNERPNQVSAPDRKGLARTIENRHRKVLQRTGTTSVAPLVWLLIDTFW